MKQKVLLSTAYLGPIQYYSKLLRYNYVNIEVYDNFIKQTYRNRCKIYGANGILQLSIPIKKDKPKTLVKDILIDYDTDWQKMHWKSIESAYQSTPFFEFYIDDLIGFYEKKTKYLIDFNTEIQNTILELIDLKVDVKLTTDYLNIVDEETDDFRELIHPKKSFKDLDFNAKEYYQVFKDKFGFKTNLSVIDLLFNEGPNSISFLI